MQKSRRRAAMHEVVGGCTAAKTKASWLSCLYCHCFRAPRPCERHGLYSVLPRMASLLLQSSAVSWVGITLRHRTLNPKPQTMLPTFQPHKWRSAPTESLNTEQPSDTALRFRWLRLKKKRVLQALLSRASIERFRRILYRTRGLPM